MKKYLVPFLYVIMIVMIGLIPLSILYYFNVLSDKIVNYLLWLLMIISMIIGSFKISYQMKYRGIINGLIFFFMFFAIMMLFNLVLKIKLSSSSIIYYIFLLLACVIGAIMGKNKKADEN